MQVFDFTHFASSAKNDLKCEMQKLGTKNAIKSFLHLLILLYILKLILFEFSCEFWAYMKTFCFSKKIMFIKFKKLIKKQFFVFLVFSSVFYAQIALSASQDSTKTTNDNQVLIYKELELEEKQLLEKKQSKGASLQTKELSLKKSSPIQKKPTAEELRKLRELEKLKRLKKLQELKKSEQKDKQNQLAKQKEEKSKKSVPKPEPQKFEDDEFNLSFLKKDKLGAISKDINILTQTKIPPGKYKVETLINSSSAGDLLLNFVPYDGQLLPCINEELLSKLNLKTEFSEKIRKDLKNSQCLILEKEVLGATSKFDTNKLQLNISTPNSVLAISHQYNFDRNQLNRGDNSLFFKYQLQHYETIRFTSQNNLKNSQSSLALSVGANMGPLHLRSFLNLSSSNFSKSNFNYGSIYGHFDLVSIYSQAFFGLINTGTLKTSNSGILGIGFNSDTNMRPINQQGYAPEITGFANTNALVILKQKDVEIYRTSVARGNFVISDLTNVSLDSNITMVIIEADGTEKVSQIPIFYIASVLRKGTYEYNTSFGFYTNNFDVNWKEPILSGEFNYGVHNNVSLLNGLSLSIFRHELGSMVVYNSPIGNFNVDLNLVHSQIIKKHYFGARFGIGYSNYFEDTKTKLALAAYNYSTNNYFSLDGVINLNKKNIAPTPTSSLKHSFNLKIGQAMPMNFGSLSFSLNFNNYWNSKKSDLNFNLNYSVRISKLNLILAYRGVSELNSKNYSDTLTIGISIPFSNAKYSQGNFSNVLYMYPNTSVKGNVPFQHDLNLGISFNKLENTSFSLGFSNNNNQSMQLSASADLNLEKIDLGSNFSYNTSNYLQFALSARGAFVLHSGGINFTKNLSDSFAIIQAKDANSALINSSYKIDSNGYGIVPSISAYRSNKVSLDIKGLPRKLTFDKTSTEIYPGNFASPLIIFETNIEDSVILELSLNQKISDSKLTSKKDKSTQNVPSGANIFNSENENVAFVGMQGRVYLKQRKLTGAYKAIWGAGEKESCNFNLEVDPKDLEDEQIPLYKINCQN